MKNMLFSVGILAAAFTTSTQANAAAFIVFDGSTGMFGNTGIGSGPFSDTLNFEVPELGSVSSSIPSVAISLLTAVSFSSVTRSDEHTSDLQSLMRISYAVLCLKQKKHINI